MRGDFLSVWDETFREIWNQLEQVEGAPDDLYCELFRALARGFKNRLKAEELADLVDNAAQARDSFFALKAETFASELSLVKALERVHEELEELAGEGLANEYFNLLTGFTEKFSLRYDLRRPCALCPTLPGMFASLVKDLRSTTNSDGRLSGLMRDFEESVRDLRYGCTDGRIRTCINKQVMLLEALGAVYPGVNKNTLGDMCDQVGTWPHAAVKGALKKIYGFASDYPGIRHGNNATGVMRAIDMRDMMAISVLLAGFTPYLTETFDGDRVYQGGEVPPGP